MAGQTLSTIYRAMLTTRTATTDLDMRKATFHIGINHIIHHRICVIKKLSNVTVFFEKYYTLVSKKRQGYNTDFLKNFCNEPKKDQWNQDPAQTSSKATTRGAGVVIGVHMVTIIVICIWHGRLLSGVVWTRRNGLPKEQVRLRGGKEEL